ncbi:MAG: hypothetical protein Q7S95_02895 [bacterium]|nr:hypothetical protein [bacterium]
MEGVVKRTRNEDKISEIDNDRGFIHSLQRSLAEAKSFVEPSHSPYAVPEEDLSGGGGLFSGGGTDPGGEMFSRG